MPRKIEPMQAPNNERALVAPNSEASIARSRQATAQHIVPHWGPSEIARLVAAIKTLTIDQRLRDRNVLLVLTLYDVALRVSEALALTPARFKDGHTGYRVDILGKGSKYREAAVSKSLMLQIRSYAYTHGIDRDALIFPINRHQAYQIVRAATKKAGLEVPQGVGNVHILRHSGAIERLRQTGNPQSLQDQLGHSTPAMTMRYLRTLTADAAIGVQESADLISEVI